MEFKIILYIMTLTCLFYLRHYFVFFKKYGFSTQIELLEDVFGKKTIIFNIYYGNKKINSIKRNIVNNIENEFLINKEHLIYINYRFYRNRLIYTLTINKDEKQLFSESAKFILNDNWGNPVIEFSK